jgi:hypothetical protein
MNVQHIMPGLDPGIHDEFQPGNGLNCPSIGLMDCRVKPGNDG